MVESAEYHEFRWAFSSPLQISDVSASQAFGAHPFPPARSGYAAGDCAGGEPGKYPMKLEMMCM